MEKQLISLLEELVVVRLLLREAEASTLELPRKLSFQHDDSDGWPVLRLKAIANEIADAPSMKIQANDRGEIIISSSFCDENQTFKLTEEGAQESLKTQVVSQISSMLTWTLGEENSAEDDLYSDDVTPSHDDLFDCAEDTELEEVEALPDILS